MRGVWIAALLLLTVAWRLWTAGSATFANTSPLMAMCFGGGLLLGYRFCWAPVVLLIGSDLALNLAGEAGIGGYTVFNAIAFTFAALAGAFFHRHRGHWTALLLGTLTCSVLFYLAANTFSWVLAPEYPKTPAGWWQSQTVGIPGPYPPSWMFLRNALFGDLAWCLIAVPLFFWAPVRPAVQRDPEVSPA